MLITGQGGSRALLPRSEQRVVDSSSTSLASSSTFQQTHTTQSFGAYISTIASRLAFSVYLTHMFVVMCTSATARERLLLSHSEFLKRFVVHVLLSFVVAMVFHLGVERPIELILIHVFGTQNPTRRCE